MADVKSLSIGAGKKNSQADASLSCRCDSFQSAAQIIIDLVNKIKTKRDLFDLKEREL